MTDKEFKRLSRSQLIEIIYQLQIKQDELIADNEKLSTALEDKRIRIRKAGDIASAAVEIHNVMQAAQDAASHYIKEIQMRVDNERQHILKDAKERADAIIADAQQEAEQIITRAKKGFFDYDLIVEDDFDECNWGE